MRISTNECLSAPDIHSSVYPGYELQKGRCMKFGKFVIPLILAMAICNTGQANEEMYMISHAGIGDPFWMVEFEGARAAADESGVDLKILSPEVPNDIVRQIELLNLARGKEPVGIAVTISDSAMLSSALKKARMKAIPVIAFNTRPEDGDKEKNPHLAYIGMNDYRAGKLAAMRALASGKINGRVLVPMHQPGVPGLESRYRGIHEVLSADGILVDKVDTTSDPEKISRIGFQYLKTHSDTTGIFFLGLTTFHVLGELVKKQGIDIYVCGFDTSPLVFNFIREGMADFTIDQQPYLQGYLAVKMLALAARYKMFPPDIDTGVGIIDKSHANLVNEKIPFEPAPANIFLVSHAGAGDPFWNVEFKGARDAAKEARVNVAILAPETPNDIVRQIELLDWAINTNPDGIATTVPDTGMFSISLKTARKKGIPVIAFNARPAEEDREKTPYLAYIGMDDYQAGKVAGRHALASGRIKKRAVVAIQQAGHAGLEARHRGIKEVLTPTGVTVDKLDTTTDPDMVHKVMGEYLKNNADVDAIFCLGPSVLHPVGRLIGKADPGPYICSFDISPTTLELIKSGVVDFTIDQQPYMQSRLAVQLLALKARLNVSPPDIDTGVGIVDKTNVEAILRLAKQWIR